MRTVVAVVFGLVAGVATVAAIVVAAVTSAPPIDGPGRTQAPPPTAIAITEPPATPTAPPATPRPVASPEPSADSTPEPSGSPGASPDPGSLFGVGTPARPLDLPAVGGGRLNLAAQTGTAVWVVFTGTWCPPCRDEYPIMARFYAQLRDQGLAIIAVHVREEEGVVAAFARQLGITFPLALDHDGAAASSWGAIALPVHFFIGRDGRIAYGALGGIDGTIMAEGLRAILPGVTIAP